MSIKRAKPKRTPALSKRLATSTPSAVSIGLDLNRGKTQVSLSEAALDKSGKGARAIADAVRFVGFAATWLLSPRVATDLAVVHAATDRLTSKLRSGARLDEDETRWLTMILDRGNEATLNRLRTAERTREHLRSQNVPEDVQPDPGSEHFFAKAKPLAESITSEHIRDLFARVLARELVTPGLSCDHASQMRL